MGCCSSASELTDLGQQFVKTAKVPQPEATTNAESSSQVLLFGPGDSGKTTLKKQLVNVFGDRFADSEFRLTFQSTIIANLLDGVIAVLTRLSELRLTDENCTLLENLKDYITVYDKELEPEMAELLITVIWKDEQFSKALETHRNDLHIQDCWFVFAEKLKTYPKWAGAGWVPTSEDCIRSRSRTSGIVDTSVMIDELGLNLVDVGGQLAERRKWMNFKRHIDAGIFVSALSEYDQTLFEDRTRNRLEDTLELFEEAIQTPAIRGKSLLVLLNKYDLFVDKFQRQKIPLNACGSFPTAPSNDVPVDVAVEWIAKEFTCRMKRSGQGPALWIHTVTATVANDVQETFAKVKQRILEKHLEIPFDYKNMEEVALV